MLAISAFDALARGVTLNLVLATAFRAGNDVHWFLRGIATAFYFGSIGQLRQVAKSAAP
jgi:hypothetical protein